MGLFGKKKEVKEVKKQEVKKQPVANNKKPVAQKVEPKRKKKMRVVDIYDSILSHLQLKSQIIDDAGVLNNERLALGFGKITTKEFIIKTFTMNSMQPYINPDILQRIKDRALANAYDTKINIIMDTNNYKINWETPEMKQRMVQYENYSKNNNLEEGGVATARKNNSAIKRLENTMKTFEYYTAVDLEWQRTLNQTSIFFEVIGRRDNIFEMENVIEQFKSGCAGEGIRIVENKADIFEWIRKCFPVSMRRIADIDKKQVKIVMTDDIMSQLLPVTQGQIGEKGVPLGIDVYSGLPVLHTFREDVEQAENILVSAWTGGGKSATTKMLLCWGLACNITIQVLDFEGDEYSNLKNYIGSDGYDKDVAIIDISAGTGKYYDPLKIADLTGEPELDKKAFDDAKRMTLVLFRVMLSDESGKISVEEESILSDCIAKVYDDYGITNDPETWKQSEDLRLPMVYDALVWGVKDNFWYDNKNSDDSMQKIAKRMQLVLKKYFVEGESGYGLFREVIDISKIRDARFIVFSFGNKGESSQTTDETQMMIKQLCVSNLTAQISAYCQYVKHQFNIKVWEEYQRWGNIKGSADLIINEFTGGRKRGSINFLITNDLDALLDETNKTNRTLRNNINGYIIGAQKSVETIKNFCNTYKLEAFEPDLLRIQQDGQKEGGGMYKFAFCCIFDKAGSSRPIKAVVKSPIHPVLLKAHIFSKAIKEDKED